MTPSRGSLWRVGGRLRPGWELLAFVPLILVTYGLIYLAGTFALRQAILAVFPTPDRFPALVAVYRLAAAAAQVAAVLLAARVWLHRVCGRSFADLGLDWRRPWLRETGLGLLVGFAAMAGIFVAEVSAGWLVVDGFAWQYRPRGAVLMSVWAGLLSMVAVAVTEEVIARGWLLRGLERWFNLKVGLVVSSVAFGVVHLVNPTNAGWSRFVVPITLTLAGFMLASAYLARRSLWMALGLHFSWNVSQYYVFGLAGQSAQDAPFLVTRVIGPAWLVGLRDSSFGPEVGMLGVVAMLAVIAVHEVLRRSDPAVSRRTSGRQH